MKKLICALLMLALLPCALAEEWMPADGAALALDAPMQWDLDGDGRMDRVELQNVGFEDDPCLRLMITAGDGAVYKHDLQDMYFLRAVVCDVQGDGRAEILICCDLYSQDYYTWCFQYDGVRLFPMEFDYAGRISPEEDGLPDAGYGALVAVGDGKITLAGNQDVMGTWLASRDFAPVDGRLALADDGLWRIRSEDDAWQNALTLTAPIQVQLSDGSAAELQPGEQLCITATDKTSIVHFAMQDGRSGSFAVELDADMGYGVKIAGLPEAEYFEYLPYAD